jgi:predicted amidohydrolase
MSRPDTADRDDAGPAERTPGHESLVTIACAQFEPHVGDLDGNRETACEFVEEAAERGADVVVLPELANSGYVFDSRAEARSLAEPIPAGETAQRWIDLAAAHDVYVVGGYAEEAGTSLYNSAVLVGPDGYVGTHRKVHLWDEEKLWFEPGDEIEVFETEIGRIGMQICYDQWFPELTRIQAAKGVDLVAEPTNWVPANDYERSGRMDADELARANYLAVSNAHTNAVWFVCADRVGTERGQPFLGRSLVVDPDGNAVAGPASRDDEELLVVEDCNLMDARTAKRSTDLNHVLRDRRTDLYDDLCGYAGDPHPF